MTQRQLHFVNSPPQPGRRLIEAETLEPPAQLEGYSTDQKVSLQHALLLI